MSPKTVTSRFLICSSSSMISTRAFCSSASGIPNAFLLLRVQHSLTITVRRHLDMVALTLQHVSKDTPNLFLVFNEQNSFCTLGHQFVGFLFAGLFRGNPW